MARDRENGMRKKERWIKRRDEPEKATKEK